MARKYRLTCELSHFYGFWVGDLPRSAQWALEANMPQIDAARFLKKCLEDGIELTPAAWFDFTMLATGGIKVKPEDSWDSWEGGDLELAEQRHNAALIRQADRESKNS